MRIKNTNTVVTGLKYAEHTNMSTSVHRMYNILSQNVQSKMESVLNLEVISDERNITKTCTCLQSYTRK
jgi:hypothetical protein